MRPRCAVVPAAVVRPLRSEVLRPATPDLRWPYDDDLAVVHVAAYDDDAVVGCASLLPPGPDAVPGAWQLRGMAVDPTWRGRGVGAAVLSVGLAEITGRGAGSVWAHARVAALPFYRRVGFMVGEETYPQGDPPIPHRRIQRDLQ